MDNKTKLRLMLESRLDFLRNSIIAIISAPNESFETEIAIIDDVFKSILRKAEEKNNYADFKDDIEEK